MWEKVQKNCLDFFLKNKKPFGAAAKQKNFNFQNSRSKVT